MQAIIQVMDSTIAVRDPYTVEHQKRTTHIATTIAQDLGLSPASLVTLVVAGRLHDLGKIAVPMEILSKPGQLTDLEFAMIKTHPQVASDILRPLNFPEGINQTIVQHHERLDGSGYPYGLAGREISMEARILAVADVVEAMCSHRPYRPAVGIERAMEEITKKRGILYDPEVVDGCLRIYHESPVAFTGELPSVASKPMETLGTLPERVTYDFSPELKEKLVGRVWQRLFPKEPRMVMHMAAFMILGWSIFSVRGHL
jgi:putative nucleotidyltransferase with HDIG domain